jgi:subtilisin-like proprotein convertase family protein
MQKAEKPSRCIRVLLICCGLGTLLLASTSRAQNVLQLAATGPSVGSEIQVELTMDFSDTTVGGGVTLAYDPAAVVLEDIEFDPSLGDDPDFRCPGSAVINCPLDPAFLSFGSVAGLSGQKTVAVVTLRLIGTVSTAIALEPASAFGAMDGTELSASLTGVVVEGVVPVPSLTPRFALLLATVLVLVILLRGGRSDPGISSACILLVALFFTPPANAQQTIDSDGDGLLDSVDNCILAANFDQYDSNDDGYGNRCDPDLDGDNHVDGSDLAALKAVFFSNDPDADLDGNGSADFLDLGVMAAYYGGPPGPACADCPLTTESGEFLRVPNAPISIPDDGSQEASDSMLISETAVIYDLDVLLSISHGWVGDLIATITHVETGTSVRLIDQPGVPASFFGCSGDDIDAILDDEAAQSAENTCASAVPTISGNLRPEETLSAFDGEGISGTWTITVTDVSLGVSGTIDGWGLSLNNPPAFPAVEMTAFRPQSETYGNPLLRRAVSDAEEEDLGAGIRINGDDDNINGTADRDDASVSDENDLIEVELKVSQAPAAPGIEYVIRRSNPNIRVWGSPNKDLAILDANDESTLGFESLTQSVWVENPNGGDAFLDFESREVQSLLVMSTDRIRFFPFTSLVIGLHGEFQFPTDPVFGPNEGVSVLAVALHGEGYDSHMYVENDVASDGSGPVYDEIVAAVQSRGVTSLALYGFSHGGGSIYDLAERLQANRAGIGEFDILFTAYIDGVENDSDLDLDPEIRLPPDTQYHVNYYQQFGFIPPWGDSVPGANVDVNVTSTFWGFLLVHITITNSINIQTGIHTPLLLLVPR